MLRVSVSGYYYWLKHPVGLRAGKEQQLLAAVRKVYQQSNGRYGSPRIAVELQQQGIQASRPRVARLMRKHAIRSIIRRKYRVQTTDSNHRYAMSETMAAEVTSMAAWQMAVGNSPITKSLLFHSDRGVQYACQQFTSQLKGMPVLQSMSRKGNCWDNAVAESFFKTMKTELIYHQKFATRQEARLAIFEYIEGWYNRKRRHSALGYLTPCHLESLYLENTVAA